MDNYSGPEDTYKELVDDKDSDWLFGLVAFAVVEEKKIEWIRHQTEHNGGEPTDEDIRNWYKQLPSGELLRARDTAQARLTDFGKDTINTFLEDYEEEIKEEAIVKEIRSATKFGTQFGINVLGGLASALLFAAILVLLAFVLLNDASPLDIGEKLGHKSTEQTKVDENDEEGSN